MNSCVIGYKGEIDKLLGDGLLALFSDPDNAVKTAIAIKNNMKLFNKVNNTNLNNGIGIGFGEIVYGNIGSESKKDFTVIGDTVNSASRLESLTKYFASDIIISDRLKDKLNHTYSIRKIDKVILKGKNDSMVIYEVLDYLPSDMIAQFLSYKEELDIAFEHYQEGKFEEAKSMYLKIKERCYKPDGLVDGMIQRTSFLIGLDSNHKILSN